jgi:hypothetical protein
MGLPFPTDHLCYTNPDSCDDTHRGNHRYRQPARGGGHR